MTEQQEKMLDVLACLTKWVQRGQVRALCVTSVIQYPGGPVQAEHRRVIPDEEKSTVIDALVTEMECARHDLLPQPCPRCKGEHRALYCPLDVYVPGGGCAPPVFRLAGEDPELDAVLSERA